jgi:hypothetical protein
VRRRKLIGFCCVTAVLGLATGWPAVASSDTSAASGQARVSTQDSAYLIREVVYNEVHDHATHGYWRYWIERYSGKETRLEEAVETADGPVARLELSDGHALDLQARAEEDRKLRELLNSPGEQAQRRKAYAEDERRIGRILALLPEAFLYEPAQEEGRSERMPECPCYHLRFRPNPDYPARSIESRIFHAMAGDLWISVDHKRLVRLDGKLRENVDFGYGILGRLYKDGWFRLERTHVTGTSGDGDWKTDRLEVHMTGRAMLFKTIARETSEVRGGFTPVPAGLSMQQAATLVRQSVATPGAQAQAAALVTSR